MAFIGNQPAESFTSFATQEFSTSATTSYTLDHAVTNENEIALFVNNVRQQPGSGKAYTASGTTLTLSAATASTDTMYCVFLGRALQTVTPATNSITTAMISDDAVTAAKISASLGKVLQVVTDISTTEESSTSSTFADTNLSLSITPSATTSKILVFSDINSMRKLGGDTKIDLKLLRGSTQIAFGRYANTDSTATLSQSSSSFHVLDTPSTTSAVTYKIQLANNSAAGTVYILSNSSTGTLTAMEIGA